MKKIFSFHTSTKIVYAAVIASVLIVSCEKQAVRPNSAGTSVTNKDVSASFNAKLKFGGKDGIDVLTVSGGGSSTTTTDSTKTITKQ